MSFVAIQLRRLAARVVNELSQDLKSGNLSAAQQDLTKIQDFQTQPVHAHHHHRNQGQAANDISQEYRACSRILYAAMAGRLSIDEMLAIRRIFLTSRQI